VNATKGWLTIALLSSLWGCAVAPSGADAEKPELSAEQRALVLDSAPSDIAKPLYLDFNGRAELLGYSLEPGAVAAPGSKLSLKLYWRSTGKLGPGYVPFTELVTAGGKRFEVQGSGPVRGGPLSPEHWELGKVYVDELDVTVPAELDATRFSIVVGLRTAPIAAVEADEAAKGEKADEDAAKPAAGQFGAVYLSVLSGPADSQHGGIIATLETGLTPGAQRARAAKDGKGLKRPPSPRPISAKPRPAP
jgi:hypothetical protein